jgi:hypothetical protein
MRTDLFANTDRDLLAKFKAFHLANGFVYEKFKEYARKIKSKGHKKYSAWTIINVIRWEEDLKTRGDVFQINNDFIALYARLLIYHFPEFEKFFELRSMKSVRRKISREESERRSL